MPYLQSEQSNRTNILKTKDTREIVVATSTLPLVKDENIPWSKHNVGNNEINDNPKKSCQLNLIKFCIGPILK